MGLTFVCTKDNNSRIDSIITGPHPGNTYVYITNRPSGTAFHHQHPTVSANPELNLKASL